MSRSTALIVPCRLAMVRPAVLLCACAAVASGWDLRHLVPPGVAVSRVALWQSRAYLAVPRSRPGVKATLIEAPWPPEVGRVLHLGVRAYPTLPAQREHGVATLQSVTAVACDGLGHLWVLDSGLGGGDAKVLVYDLWRTREVARSQLTGVPTAELRALVLDVTLDNHGPRTLAYIGDPGDGGLIVYSLRGQQWWRLKLRLPKFTHPGLRVSSSDMAMSKRSPLLYVTSQRTDQLFGVDLKRVRTRSQPPPGTAQAAQAQALGSKLGPSTGLAVDLQDGLHYFLPRFHVALRWDTRKPLVAEYHSVLLQSAAILPAVNDIFVDPQAQVWALVNQSCVKLQDPLNLPRLALL